MPVAVLGEWQYFRCANNYFAQFARKTVAQVVEMKRREKRYKLTKYAMFG